MTSLPPKTQSYGETFRDKGIPLDQLPAFIDRAREAGAPSHARLHLEEVKPNFLTGFPIGGTRAVIIWPYQEPCPKPSPESDAKGDPRKDTTK